MNEIFADMFIKYPVEIPWYWASEKFAQRIEQKDYNLYPLILSDWNERTFQDDFDSYDINKILMYDEIVAGTSQINEVFAKIAADGKPIMDISSSHSFGLIPYIAKLNPKIPCMATDLDKNLIEFMSLFLENNLTEYNLSLACFDNYDMPIKDNSMDCVTGMYGILSCQSPNTRNGLYERTFDKEKPISEVYRILKPSGCFVTIESIQDWKFDLEKVRESCNRHGKLFGKFTYEHIETLYNKLKVPTWRELFETAGFKVEIEEKYPRIFSRNEIRTEFFPATRYFKTYEWSENEQKEYFKLTPEDRKYFDNNEDIGIELSAGAIFYVLKKE